MKDQSISAPRTIPWRLLTTLAVTSLLSFTPVLRAADSSYVAHEWGTFTSIQGSDGVLLDWNGSATDDLPEFVYNWSRPGLRRWFDLGPAKGGLYGLQRMETPVIYFYPEKPMSVDVTVDFPKGRITEWFPQARDIGPSTYVPNPILTALDSSAIRVGLHSNPTLAARIGDKPITNSVIRWSGFNLVPAKSKPELIRQLPVAQKASHYFAARVTESAFVRVDSMERTNSAPDVEKFLFYRGVGTFQTPLKVTISDQKQITLANTGGATLRHLFALKVHGDRASFTPLGNLGPSQIREPRVDLAQQGGPLTETAAQLSKQMADALESEGLYRAEAEAMVGTWRDAWFEEQGVRILYVLPRVWTDQILPITLDPQPRELVRVMVGRSELITPGMEAQVRECVTRFRQSDPGAKHAAVRGLQAMKLGRFATAAVRFVAGRMKDQAFSKAASDLIQAAAAPQPASATLSSL